MVPPLSVFSLPLAQVDWEAHSLDFRRPSNWKPMCASLRKYGLLHPVLVTQDLKKFAIVDGFRRLRAAEELGLNDVIARRFDGKPEEALLLKIETMLLERPLNPAESALTLGALEKHFSRSDIFEKHLERIGLSKDPRIFEKMKALRNLPEEAFNALAAGLLPVGAAQVLAKFPLPEAEALFEFISPYALSTSKQKEVLTLLFEITRRDGTSIKELLSELKSESHDGETLRGRLKLRRFPRLSQKEDRYLALTSEFALSSDISLQPPPAFEGDSYRLEFRFKNEADFQNKVEKLRRMADHPRLGELWED